MNAQTKIRFVLCIRNEAAEDLEVRKLYQILPDKAAAQNGYVRIIDESGEDYLYPADYFVSIDLPQSVERALVAAH